MRALVVYESMFGNTQRIAEAVAAGLGGMAEVEMVEVGAAPSTVDPELGLLVVGAPTQAFGLSRPGTRDNALGQAPDGLVSRATGVREWLEKVGTNGSRVPVATFDTRFDKPAWVTGSAAKSTAKRLRRLGHRVLAAPESFFVLATTGPLREGEERRAREWGRRLGTLVDAERPHPVT